MTEHRLNFQAAAKGTPVNNSNTAASPWRNHSATDI